MTIEGPRGYGNVGPVRATPLRSGPVAVEEPPSPERELSLTEWVVLALLAERPAHGFALAKELRPGADLGRVMSVHRPLVYRALDRLVTAELAEGHHTEPGDAGPRRTLHRPTEAGRTAVEGWLDRPVVHIRDLRLEFLVKLRLNQRRRRDAGPLVRAQQSALRQTFDQLTAGPAAQPATGLDVDPGTEAGADVVDRWRHHTAAAARRFLAELASETEPGPGRRRPTLS